MRLNVLPSASCSQTASLTALRLLSMSNNAPLSDIDFTALLTISFTPDP